MKPIKVGVVGVGSMGKNHLRVLSTMPEFELVGVFDANAEAAASQAQQYGITNASSLDQLFSLCDAIHVVVPSFLHKDVAIKAAQAGCHILVEKPLALDINDGQAIIDAAQKAGVILQVGHVERYNPAVTEVAKILADEELLALDFHRLSPFDPRVSDADVVEDLMIHDLDVMNYLVNSPVNQILSQGIKVHTDKLDHAQALVSFENGVKASLTASRITETKIRTLRATTSHAFIEADYMKRTVQIYRKTNFKLDVGYAAQYSQENIVEKVYVAFSEPLRNEFHEFASAIKENRKPLTSGEYGLLALKQSDQIIKSALGLADFTSRS